MGQLLADIIATVGSTPGVGLVRLTQGLAATIALKCEFFNLVSSIKAAEAEGRVKPVATVMEPTSGNTGIAPAFARAARGCRLVLTMPETMSVERRALLAMPGARVVLAPGAEGLRGAIHKAEELLEQRPPCYRGGRAGVEASFRASTAQFQARNSRRKGILIKKASSG